MRSVDTVRTVAGRYLLLDRLGAGGMGTVWRAQDTVLGRGVALKEVTFPHNVSDQEREVLRERTRREGRAAARLDHPSAVTVYDVAEEDGTPFLVMELVDARTLSEVIRADGPLTPRRTAEVGLAVLGALEAAHAQGILHRDVKPSNVLLRADGRVVLTDFGIATFIGDSSITSTGLLLGSPSYIAPERARGERTGPPSDLWSLGATLFTAVEGRPPFDKGEPLTTLAAVVTGEHEPFLAAGPLAPVLDGLLLNDPALRSHAAQARAGLNHVLAATSTPRAASRPPVTIDLPEARHRTQALSLDAVAAEVRHGEQVPLRTPGPPHARARVRAKRAPLLAGALALALTTVLALVLFSTSGSRPNGTVALKPPSTRASGAASGAPSAGGATDPRPASSGPAADPRPASGGPAITAGWTVHTEQLWTVAVPPSYAAGVNNGIPQYKDPATGRTLRVSTTAAGGGKPDAVKDRRDQAAAFATRHPSYREISIAKADYRGREAADWEFTYTDSGVALHALSRVFVVNGRGYSLFFQTRGGDNWSAARADFDAIAATFRP